MKIAYLVPVLAMTTTLAVACDDDADRVAPRHVAAAGSSGSAGKNGSSAGSANGGSSGSTNGGSSGSTNGGSSSPVGGAGGAPAPGGAAGNDAGGESNVAAAGEAGATGNGGAGGEGSVSPPPLELIGSYDDNFGDSFVITQDAWGPSAVAAYDNDANVVYTQFPADDPYSPNKFAKTVYTEPANNSFYYCMVVYDADTLAAAQASTATADPSDPDNGGCGGTFPWSKATKQ